MAANLEMLEQDSRFGGQRRHDLAHLANRFREIPDFPEHVDTDTKENLNPLEAIGQGVKRAGFPKEGQILINQSRRYEFFDMKVREEEKPSENVIYKFDGIEYRPKEHIIVKEGKEKVLAKKRNATLRILVEHADRVVPYQRLIDDVWSGKATIQALRMNIQRLRQHVGRERIEAVVGEGLIFHSQIDRRVA